MLLKLQHRVYRFRQSLAGYSRCHKISGQLELELKLVLELELELDSGLDFDLS